MQDTYYSDDFRFFVARGRYAVYAVLFCIVSLNVRVYSVGVITVLVSIVVLPAMLQLASFMLALRVTRRCNMLRESTSINPLTAQLVRQSSARDPSIRRPIRSLFLLEWMFVLGLLLLSDLSVVAAGAFAFTVLACHTAIWGWRWLLSSVFVGFVFGGLLYVLGQQQIVSLEFVLFGVPWVDGLAALASVGFMLMISAVAYQQAQQILRAGQLLKNNQQALMRYLPKDLPEHLLGGSAYSIQRVWLTVVFVDLVGFTQATQRLSAEELAEVLNTFLTTTNTLVDQWGGWVSKFLGDGVLCVFASNHAEQRSNSAIQALHCVRQLPTRLAQDAICEHEGFGQQTLSGETLIVTAGVASGYCYVGDWGGLSRLDYTVIGVPVNLASRLQGAAKGHGGLLLDATTSKLVQSATQLGEQKLLTLKGFGQVSAQVGNPE